VAIEGEAHQLVDECVVGNARGRPELGIHGNRGEAGDRVDLVDEQAASVGFVEEIDPGHPIDPQDRDLLGLLLATEIHEEWRRNTSFDRQQAYTSVRIAPAAYDLLLPRLAASGRLALQRAVRSEMDELSRRQKLDLGIPLRIEPDAERRIGWTGGEPWRFRLLVVAEDADHGNRIATEWRTTFQRLVQDVG
jgi:hypothetical protein